MSDQDGDGDATRVEVMHRSTTYRGFFRVDRFRLRHRLFAGGMSQAVTREVFERGDAVAVLPYDPVRDAVVLVEQFRIGAFAREQSPWLMEIIAGTIEKGERPDAVARREAQEEAGLELGRLERVLTTFLSPGGSTERLTVYCAEARVPEASSVHGLPEEGEDIRVHPLPADQALKLLRDGAIVSAPAVIALLWLASQRERLRALWQDGSLAGTGDAG